MMKGLELNLASRPFRNNTPIWTAQAALLGIVILYSAWNAHTAVTATRKMEALQADLGSVERQLVALDQREDGAIKGIRAFDLKTLTIQADKANDIILRRGLSWTRLFNTLERVVPYEVRLTAVRPTYGGSKTSTVAGRDKMFEGTVPIDVEGVAQNFEAFLEFERSLIMDPHFAGVEPLSNESQPGSTEVKFQIRFLYDPEGRISGEHPDLPHMLDAARKNAEEGGEAPPSALEGLQQ